MNNDIYQWIRNSFTSGNRIKNRSLEEFKLRYGLERIPLEQYILVMKGMDKQASIRIYICRLIACTSGVPLTGAHWMEIAEVGPEGVYLNSTCSWFKSLTFLKKRYCQMVDRLSISRCCYLIMNKDGENELVRLKSVLSIVDLPCISTWDDTMNVYDPDGKNLNVRIKHQMQEFKEAYVGETVISQRTDSQLVMCLHQVYNGMRRSNRRLTEDDVINKFQIHVHKACLEICQSIKPKIVPEIVTIQEPSEVESSDYNCINEPIQIARFPEDFYEHPGEACAEWYFE